MNRRNFIQTTGLSVAGISLAGTGLASSTITPAAAKRPICVFSKCLQFLSIDEMGEVLARQGFDGADMPVRPAGQIEPANAKTELPAAVKTLQKHGVGIPMIVTAVTNADDQKEADLLRIAADCGIKYYRMGWLAYEANNPTPQSIDNFKRKFEKLAELNQKLGIHGGYQNHSGLHVGAPVWDLYDLLKEVDPRWLGVQYDIRHATTEGGYSWPISMKRIEPWIRTICIKDFVWGKNDKGKWAHQNVPLGEGMINFDQFLPEYAKLKVEAPISIHYEYDLGGAELGKKETTMSRDQIYAYLKKDLGWLRDRMKKYQIER